MVAFGDQFVGNKRMRSVAVDIALLVHSFFHESSVSDDSHVTIAELESVQATIFLRPLGESCYGLAHFLDASSETHPY